MIYKQDETGACLICSFPPFTAQRIRIDVDEMRADFAFLNEVEVINSLPIDYNGEFRFFSYFVGNSNITKSDYGNVAEYFKESTDLIYIGDMGWDADCDLYFSRSKNTQNETEWAEKLANVKACIAASGKDIRLWGTVGNPGDDTAQSLQGEKKEKLIQNLAAFAEKYDLAGLDFDWEYPYSGENWAIYSEFLVDLKRNSASKMCFFS